MTSLVPSRRGFVNVAHVHTLTRTRGDADTYIARGADGTVIDEIEARDLPDGVVVPNTTAATLLHFFDVGGTIDVERYLIVAWRMAAAVGPTPVLLDSVDLDRDVWCVEQPMRDRTTYVFVCERTCASFDDALAFATGRIERQRRPR